VVASSQLARFLSISSWVVDFPSKGKKREFTQIKFSANNNRSLSFDRHTHRAIILFGIIATQIRPESTNDIRNGQG
jgi:hypothetical protein